MGARGRWAYFDGDEQKERKKRCWSPDAIEKRWVEYFNRAIN
jgi:hypothetical protein